MNNKPEFYKVYQALSKVRQQFVTQLQYKLYAYHGYHYIFKNEDVIIKSFLNSIDATNAKAIYEDPTLGMDSVTKLYYWFMASSSRTSEDGLRAYFAIVSNFQARGIVLTPEKMDQLIGPQSLFAMIYTTLSSTIQTVFRMHGGFVDTDLLF
jgi:hypothetical protein